MLSGGCDRPGQGQKDPEHSNPPEERSLHTTGGETTRRRQLPHGRWEPVWAVQWESADLSYLTEKQFKGRMNGVSGKLYQDGKPFGRFGADAATAYKESDRLTLSGHVKLTMLRSKRTAKSKSGMPKTRLTCDELEWDAGEGVIKAKKNVYVDTLDYKIGPFTEYWATPDFTLAGTPDLFLKNPAARSKMKHGAKGL